MHQATLGSIYTYLQNHLPVPLHAPSLPIIQSILTQHFHLRYRRASPAATRYLDPSFNEKRLWTSRLLAQFLFEGAVIISIDESNFRADSFSKRQWCFQPKVAKVSQLLNGTQLEDELERGALDWAETESPQLKVKSQQEPQPKSGPPKSLAKPAKQLDQKPL